jgi:hypothetical protein
MFAPPPSVDVDVTGQATVGGEGAAGPVPPVLVPTPEPEPEPATAVATAEAGGASRPPLAPPPAGMADLPPLVLPRRIDSINDLFAPPPTLSTPSPRGSVTDDDDADGAFAMSLSRWGQPPPASMHAPTAFATTRAAAKAKEDWELDFAIACADGELFPDPDVEDVKIGLPPSLSMEDRKLASAFNLATSPLRKHAATAGGSSGGALSQLPVLDLQLAAREASSGGDGFGTASGPPVFDASSTVRGPSRGTDALDWGYPTSRQFVSRKSEGCVGLVQDGSCADPATAEETEAIPYSPRVPSMCASWQLFPMVSSLWRACSGRRRHTHTHARARARTH